mmetsp:Transcript_11330/g.21584  ORF Transcript_11330/g.21584 Transcript_11330/m.21584 type:complete len:358 (+) Transcript_11330:196-1269(+)
MTVVLSSATQRVQRAPQHDDVALGHQLARGPRAICGMSSKTRFVHSTFMRSKLVHAVGGRKNLRIRSQATETDVQKIKKTEADQPDSFPSVPSKLSSSATPEPLASSTYPAPGWVLDGRGLVACAALFAVVSADLTFTQLMANGPDAAIHQFITSHLSPEQRLWWDQSGSNWAIYAAVAAGFVTLVAAVLADKPGNALRAVRAGVLGQAAYLTCAGSIPGSDPAVVMFLKETFHRARPSALHHSFAFPSGHTTAAAFTAGLLLWVLLPLAFPSTNTETGKQAAPAVEFVASNRTAIFAALVALAACGRMLADVHWLSDTLAGASLGSAVAISTTMVFACVEAFLDTLDKLSKSPENL